MSSFKKRTTTLPIPGTRPSSSSSLSLISTGLPTIDDLLGGGLPLSTSLLITQDYPTSYSELLSRYFIAQGLESNQECLIISSSFDQSGGPQGITRLLMGTDQGITSTGGKKQDREDEEEKKLEQELQEKMKIAFRYEGMKLHQTTLQSSTPTSESLTHFPNHSLLKADVVNLSPRFFERRYLLFDFRPDHHPRPLLSRS